MTQLTRRPLVTDIDGVTFAADIREMFTGIVDEGPAAPWDLQVVPKNGTIANPDAGGAGRDRSVDVLGPGYVWVKDDNNAAEGGLFKVFSPNARENIAVPANLGGTNRFDAIIARVDEAGGWPYIELVQGPSGGGEPTIPGTAAYLARVRAQPSFTQITAADVTDKRQRARRHLFYVDLGSDVRLTQSQWTPILSLTFTLGRDQTVLVFSQTRANSNGATATGLVATQLVVDGTPSSYVAGPTQCEATPDRRALLNLFAAIPLTAGQHTISVEGGRDGTGIVDAAGSITFTGRTFRPTSLGILT